MRRVHAHALAARPGVDRQPLPLPETPGKALPAFPAKAWAHLPKPFALSTLLHTVRALLDSSGR